MTDLGAKVTCISFSPLEPHNFVVSASSRLTVFDGATGEVKKTLNRFRAEAYSACYRSDGKLIVAGGEDPVIQVRWCEDGRRQNETMPSLNALR